MKKEKIGIYGGSFSPPHRGHIHAAKAFLSELNLDRVVIMPAGIPPHKQLSGGVSGETRLELCRAAFEGIPGLTVSDYEIEKKGVSYTVDTLRHFTADDRELYLLCGDDMFLSLDTWRCPEEIFKLSHIVSMRRYDGGASNLRAKGEEYREKYGARIHYIDLPPYPMSSTEVRELLGSGRDTESALPQAVRDIILSRGLYGTEHEKGGSL